MRRLIYSIFLIFVFTAGAFAQKLPLYAQWISEAQKGDSEKQYLAGLAFYRGIAGAKRNYQKAYQWFLKAAKNNEPAACIYLGDMRSFGHFAAKNEKKAFNWYLKAARLNNPQAMEKLGDIYVSSPKFGGNYFEAAKWYEKAALSAEIPESSVKLAKLYYFGNEHFEKNEDKALKWFKRAFKLGDASVAHYISGIYEDKGENREAAQWLLKGAMKGSSVAMYYLAKAYARFGEYSDKTLIEFNYVQAYKWLYILVRKEYQPRFEKALKEVASRIKKSEIKKAKKLAAPLLLKLVSKSDLKWSKYSKRHPLKMK